MQRVFKKHLTPIGKKGSISNHIGKAAVQNHLSGAAGGGSSMMAPSANDYTKATPMAAPQMPSDPNAGQRILPAGSPQPDNDEND